MKKNPVIKKENRFECGQCSGSGYFPPRYNCKPSEKPQQCPNCNGKGYYIENHYYFIDYEKGIAIDADNLN